MSSPVRIAILSANETPWGGSEELWYEAALALAAIGCDVRILKPRLPRDCDRIAKLAQAGCRVTDLTRPFFLPQSLFDKVTRVSRVAAIFWLMSFAALRLLRIRPQLVVLGQGGNWDGVHFSWIFRRLKLPYVVISQKAAEFYWPPDHLRSHVQKLYRGASHAYFVSNHNWRLTELQIGEQLDSASVVRNPFLVRFDAPLPWPDDDGVVKIACVGRLYPMEKGQDLLLQVLAMPKWRDRPLRVTFYGEGVNREGLEGIASMLGLDNVHFAGQVDDIAEVWRDHSLLVLPSRAEGLPLVIVEAMLAGRVVVATSAGGNGEAFEDNVSGFLAEESSVAGLDEAMERAWSRRLEWPSIATAASSAIRTLVPADPGAELARQIVAIASPAKALQAYGEIDSGALAQPAE